MLLLKCSALHPIPCANATKGYITTKPEMNMTLCDLEDDDDDE